MVLFLAQSVSIAFYAIGFGEAMAALLGDTVPLSTRGAATVAVLVLFVPAWLGADWATRFQYVIMAVLFTAIAVFFVGGLTVFDSSRLVENWQPSGNLAFWGLFALFFPAVTGFTQGVSMSGDLADPARSLPLGTFLAVGISAVIYLLGAVVMAGALSGDDLVRDYGAMRRVAVVPWLIDAGVLSATLSSALASFLGAPRILQSLARDRVFRFLDVFAAGAGEADNPRRGVLLSAAIALGLVAYGNINVLAPVVTMFFLISYGLLNYATYYEARTGRPSFRPTFHWFHPRLSLLGSLACLGGILAIHPAAGAVALVFLLGIRQYVRRHAGPERWADSSRSMSFQRIRENLLSMSSELEHPSDWRPVILAFSDDPGRRERLARFASWIEGGSGLTTIVRLVQQEGVLEPEPVSEAEVELREEIRERGIEVFSRILATGDFEEGYSLLLQAHGLGAIRANVVLVNWYDQESVLPDTAHLMAYGHHLRLALRFGLHCIVLHATTELFKALERVPPEDRRIDVWWRGHETSRLALLLAYLVTRTDEWKSARIRVLCQKSPGGSGQKMQEEVHGILREARIEATPEVIDGMDSETVKRESSGASLVFLPISFARGCPVSTWGESLWPLLEHLPTTALCMASRDVPLDAEPEGGQYGEVALTLDRAEQQEKVARDAEKAAAEARKALEKLRQDAETRGGEDVDRARDLSTAEANEAEASRRAAAARAEADRARAEAAKLTGDEGDTGSDGGRSCAPG
jgi:hypothetical protein